MIEPQYKKNCIILLSNDYSTNLASIIHFEKSLQVFERIQRQQEKEREDDRTKQASNILAMCHTHWQPKKQKLKNHNIFLDKYVKISLVI